jgi:hypothetical protein
MWRVFAAPLMIMHRRNRLTAPGGLRLTLLLSNPGTFFADISTLGISGPSLIHNAA